MLQEISNSGLNYFNSIKVRLEQNYEKNLSIRQTNFNSIKVRLEQSAGPEANILISISIP